jgi:hypothetical protein
VLNIIILILIPVIAGLITAIIVKLIKKKKNNKPIIATVAITAVLLGILLVVNYFDKKAAVVSGETEQDDELGIHEGDEDKPPPPHPPKPIPVSPKTVTVSMGSRQDFFDGRISIHVENISTGWNNDNSSAVYLLYGDIIIDKDLKRLAGAEVGFLLETDDFDVQFIGLQNGSRYNAEFRITPHY